MAGHRKFNQLRSPMAPTCRARNRAATAAMLAEMPLSELRQARQLTQEALAAVLEADQGNISKLQHHTDMYISTLRRYIEALGGDLEITAHFPDGDVRITQFQDVDSDAA